MFSDETIKERAATNEEHRAPNRKDFKLSMCISSCSAYNAYPVVLADDVANMEFSP
jgi:hypothetical protein